MNKYYMFWHDYNGTYVESFMSIDEAESRCAGIMLAAERDGYGIEIDGIIHGTEMIPKVVERVATIVFEEKGG